MCAGWEARHSLTRRGQAGSGSHTTTVRWIPTRGGLILPAGPSDALWEETDHHDGEREDHDLCGDLGPDAGHDRAGARDERGPEERSEQGTGPADQDGEEEHTSELQSRLHLVCRLLLEKKKKNIRTLYKARMPSQKPYGRRDAALAAQQKR